MKDISDTLEYRGVKYPLVFNINVLQEIQKKYGSFEDWGNKVLKENGETDLDALIGGVQEMINEGIDIHNETAPEAEKLQPLTYKQTGRLLTAVGLDASTDKILSLIAESNKPAGEQPKNE